MAEVLGIVSGSIAVVQLAAGVGGTIVKLVSLWDEIQDVPDTIQTLMATIQILGSTLQCIDRQLDNTSAQLAVTHCEGAMRKLSELTENLAGMILSEKRTVRTKGKAKVVLRRGLLTKLETQLQGAVQLLSFARQEYIIFLLKKQPDVIYERLQIARSVCQPTILTEPPDIESHMCSESNTKQDIASVERLDHRSFSTCVSGRRAAIKEVTTYLLGVHSWLRYLGLFGSYTYTKRADDHWVSRVLMGVKFPASICVKSLFFQLQLGSLPDRTVGISLQPSQIRLQNRIPIDSPFMAACRKGNVAKMKVYLEDWPGMVNGRTVCTGKTPLHLAIESESLEAIRFLLAQGADPNMVDDDLVPPSFTVVGMRPRFNRLYVQLPPTWDSWLEALRVLLINGASTDEVVHYKTLGMLNINTKEHDNLATEYFGLLHAHDFMDFNTTDSQGWSPLRTAIRGNNSVKLLRMLKTLGTDLDKTLDSGSTFFHIAAESSIDSSALEYLYHNGCWKHLDRQDSWGWTPLHYAVLSVWYSFPSKQYRASALSKVRFLATQEPDMALKGRKPPFVYLPDFDNDDEFSPVEMAQSVELLDSVYDGFANVIREALKGPEQCDESEVFYDAAESL